MSQKTPDEIRQIVRKNYGAVAESGDANCGCASSSCCGDGGAPSSEEIAKNFGYSDEELGDLPEGANMGLGCGNPQAIAALKAGETVVDLGSGGGFDCFLAARQVGETGRVIGVDMTPEMISKARANAEKGGFANVEFRLGEIEHLPVADSSVHAILSNCVINLSPDKSAVYSDAIRILKSGGRLAISDVVATKDLPDSIANDPALYCGCAGGAAKVSEIEAMLLDAGFVDILVKTNEKSREVIKEWFPGTGIEEYVVSATIEAIKP
jgi:arsenite methyltransferase